jgi:2,3-bisphosphoglycerate-independent phosphoglycerate mutase
MLLIRDGWGFRKEKKGNAIAAAATPVHDRLFETYPWIYMSASGRQVGLPAGIMGNSEVGHLNLGAGRIVKQEQTVITEAIEDGTFFTNPALIAALENAKKNNTRLHLMGLCSDGLVHSDLNHLYALLELAKQKDVSEVFIHCLLDGRDTLPKRAPKYISQVEEKCAKIGVGRIASVAGRYYTMDRDKRWDRVRKGYDALVYGRGETAASAQQVVENAYARGETDEFVLPTVILDSGSPVATVRTDDSFVFYNFRADRARQITKAFTLPDFDGWEREEFVKPYFVQMTQYEDDIPASVAFPPHEIKNNLGTLVSQAGMRQLRIAETEKYAHVTFFFSSGVEDPYEDEDRCLIPSPRVATYDLQPEMSAYKVTEEVLKRIDSDAYNLIVLNFANPDMVGHTGVFKAAVKAVEVIDECVGRVIEAVMAKGGTVLITADHGNCELMIDPESGGPHTAHTTSPVHFMLVDNNFKDAKLLEEDAKLADVAPTLMHFLGLEAPPEMTGRCLLAGG